MVPDLIRDSTFGHLVRLATGGKAFQYAEERDPELWKKYVNEEKSGYLAHYGEAQPLCNGGLNKACHCQEIRGRVDK